MKYLEH